MLQKLVNHNDDIRRVVEKGYAVAFDSNSLIVRDIPYLDSDLQLQWGAFVAKLEFVDNEKVRQDNHQVYFAGSSPYGLDRRPIPNLGDSPHVYSLTEACRDVVVQRAFSNKPRVAQKYADFFEKFESYTNLISGPAMELFGATPFTFRAVAGEADESVFKFRDTLTTRAEITDLAAGFKNEVVAVIGLGGTGAYVVDFLTKTPVKEIRGFDRDHFHVHNAFRSPGRLDESELGETKAEVYRRRYENFRTGVSVSAKFVDATSAADFQDVTFAFVCVDKGSSRSGIFDLLIGLGIPFIDVGMGLNRNKGAIDGTLRTTLYSPEVAGKVAGMQLAPMTDNPDDIYRNNIQIAELNAINACLAVLRYKQTRGFYHLNAPIYQSLFQVGGLKTFSEAWPE